MTISASQKSGNVVSPTKEGFFFNQNVCMTKRSNTRVILLVFTFSITLLLLCSTQTFPTSLNFINFESKSASKNYVAEELKVFNSKSNISNLLSQSTDDSSTSSSSNCDKTIRLPYFTSKNSEKNQVFFLETSGRPYLSGRQICSVETAVLNSGLIPKVILKSPVLDLSNSKSLCNVYNSYGKSVEFYTIDFEALFKGTPVEGILPKVEKVVNHGVTHLSAISRKALVFKYGGFYLDLDIVVLNNLTQMQNVYPLERYSAMSEKKTKCLLKDETQSADLLNNGHFHLVPGHSLARAALQYYNDHYDPNKNYRGQAGPLPTGRSFKDLYKVEKITNRAIPNENLTSAVTILADYVFMPVHWSEAKSRLWTNVDRSGSHWDFLFSCSDMVHFFSYVSSSLKVTGNPKREAYSYLGPTHCPKSFTDLPHF